MIMHILSTRTLALTVCFAASGCVIPRYLMYNFEKDKVMVANVGAEMINVTEASMVKANGPAVSSFERTLTYSGKQGNVIKIFYRESANNLARPSFTQELTYDITGDSIIVFKDTRIKVQEATNSLIKFTVLQSPEYKYVSGAEIRETSLGTDAKQYPSNTRIIIVLKSGKVLDYYLLEEDAASYLIQSRYQDTILKVKKSEVKSFQIIE